MDEVKRDAATRDAFGWFLLARTVSWAGSAVTLVALPIILYTRTGSPGLTALLTALEALPYLVFGLLAGALADRWSRRRLMVWTSVTQSLVLLTIPLADRAGELTTAHLLIAATVSSTLAVFFDAAGFGALPALVPKERLAHANSACVSAGTIIGLVGPPIGGGLVALVGGSYAITVDAASFLLAALLIRGLPLDHSIRSRTAKNNGGGPATTGARTHRTRTQGIAADIADGLRYCWRHPLIRPLTLLGFGNSLVAGAVLGLIIVVAAERIGVGAETGELGLFYAATGAGAFAASLLLPRISARAPVGWITLAGLVVNWVLTVLWASMTSMWPALVVLALWQVSSTLIILNGITVRMQVTPEHLQARVNTTARMIAWGGQPLGAALGGVLAEHVGVHTALLYIASAVLVAFALGLTTDLRRRNLSTEQILVLPDGGEAGTTVR